MTKALFYGGAFNPVTKAHIDLAHIACKQINFDKVIFVPSKDKYIRHDEKKDFVFCENDRLNLLNGVAKNNDWMIVSDYEIKEVDQPRTYMSLCHFRDLGYDMKLLIGSDWLDKLENGWKYVDEIGKEFGFVIMSRNHDNLKEMIENNSYLKSIKSYFTLIKTNDDYQDISSSKVRKLVLKKDYEAIKEYLPDEIYSSFVNMIKR